MVSNIEELKEEKLLLQQQFDFISGVDINNKDRLDYIILLMNNVDERIDIYYKLKKGKLN